MPDRSRRRVLAALGAGFGGPFAGCGGIASDGAGPSPSGTGPSGSPGGPPTATGPPDLSLTGELVPGSIRLPGIVTALSGGTALLSTPSIDGGRALVFEESGRGDTGGSGMWQETATLRPPEPAPQFGWETALEGGTAAIGSAREVDGTFAPSVHVFTRTGGSWMHQQQLAPPAEPRISQFGRELALHDDRLLVGGIGGGVAIHRRGDGTWPRETILRPPQARSSFGKALAFSGETAVVGAPGYRGDGSSTTGAAYIYRDAGGGWQRTQRLLGPDLEGSYFFGEPVACLGDRLAVGDIGDRSQGTRTAGAVHLFERGDGGWTHRTKLVDEDGGPGDKLPQELAIGADLILAQGEVDDGPGRVEVFGRGGDGWEQLPSDLRPAGDDRQSFGIALAVEGGRALVGAKAGGEPTATPDEFSDPANPDGGLPSAYVFEF